MRNIRLTIEYDGTGFCGWQAQKCIRAKGHPSASLGAGKCISKKIKTIQEEIENAGKKLFGKRIRLIGSGRTDAGVHAEAQVANFKIDSNLPLDKIKKGLNSYLPKDIAIISAEDVGLAFHSRFQAKEKLYRYRIINRNVRSPLLQRHGAHIFYNLDIKAMEKAARYFVGKKDFRSFEASGKKERTSVRTITRFDLVSKPPLIEMYIQADGFLYNMVRNIVGTLIDVGRGRIKPDEIKEILSKKHRSSAGQTAPANGLCLVKVFYTFAASEVPSEARGKPHP